MKKLNDRQEKIFHYIEKYIKKNRYAPSYREIGRDLDIPSTSTVYADIHKLIDRGYLSMDKGSYRSLKVIASREDQPEKEESSREKKDSSKEAAQSRDDILDIPVYGDVAAGLPIYADDYIEETLPLPASFFPRGSDQYFILTVQGESMIEAGIFDGDKLICKKADIASNGQKVVALVEDSATVKTFYQRDGYVELHPENSSMKPILLKECKILGIVIGLYRLYPRS